jgi:hypothetical protein
MSLTRIELEALKDEIKAAIQAWIPSTKLEFKDTEYDGFAFAVFFRGEDTSAYVSYDRESFEDGVILIPNRNIHPERLAKLIAAISEISEFALGECFYYGDTMSRPIVFGDEAEEAYEKELLNTYGPAYWNYLAAGPGVNRTQ